MLSGRKKSGGNGGTPPCHKSMSLKRRYSPVDLFESQVPTTVSMPPASRSYKKKRGAYSRARRTSQSVLRYPSRGPYRSIAYAADRNKVVIPVAAQLQMVWNPAFGLGIGGSVFDVCFSVNQSGFEYQQNNNSWTTVNWANYTALAALFQQYRIMSFEIELFYSNTELGQGSVAATTTMPLIHSIIDREDALSVQSSSSMLQYASCMTKQMGAGHTIKRKMPKPSAFGVNDNDATLVGTTAPAQVQYSPWLSCGSNSAGGTAPVIPHGYMKYYVDQQSVAGANAVVGIFTFVVRAVFEYRGID